MAKTSSRCPKCGEGMEAGHIPGPANFLAYRVTVSTQWFPGSPPTTPSFALGKSKRRTKTVETWRCMGCGFLESYAR